MIYNLDLTNDFHYSIFAGNSLKIRKEAVGETRAFDWPEQEYIHNSYGFRGKEFSGFNDLVVAGCSYTYGVGVPEAATWGSQVSSRLGMPISAPVAKPGASVAWIVERLFAYFAEFGHPKYLLCLFPDAYRTVVPIDQNILTAGEPKEKPSGETGTFGPSQERLYIHQVISQSPSKLPKYSKRPHNVKNVYTAEISIFEAVRSIRFLEQYCSAVGIKLNWTTWNKAFGEYITKANEIEELRFKNFFDLNILTFREKLPSGVKEFVLCKNHYDDMSMKDSLQTCINAGCICPEGCHEDLKKLYGEKNFNIGTDVVRGEGGAHPGIHVHAHYADRFIEQLMLEYPHEFK
jgi:hypothetical protein